MLHLQLAVGLRPRFTVTVSMVSGLMSHVEIVQSSLFLLVWHNVHYVLYVSHCLNRPTS